MSALGHLNDSEIRSTLKSYGVTEIGPINASTRGAYLKKLERLQKEPIASDGDPQSQSSVASKGSPKTRRSQRSTSASRRSTQQFNGESSQQQNEVIPPSPIKKQTVPHRPPPTATFLSDEIIFPTSHNLSKVPGEANVVSSATKKTKSIDNASHNVASGRSSQIEATYTKPNNGTRYGGVTRAPEPDTSQFLQPRQTRTKTGLPEPVVKPKASISTNASFGRGMPTSTFNAKGLDSSFGSSTYPASSAVDDFRSKLTDENLWLNRFSLDTNLTARRRPLAESSRVSSQPYQRPEDQFSHRNQNSMINNGKSTFWPNLKQKFDGILQYSQAVGLKFKSIIENMVSGQEDEEPNRIVTRRIAGARDFVQPRKTTITGRSKSFGNLRPETSRYIQLLLLSFLFLIFTSYFCVVYRDYVKKAAVHTYAASIDTVEFVYRKMILPVICVVTITAFVYGIFWFKRYKWHKVAEEQRQIFEMVEEIIAILKKHHEECQADGNRPPYLAVPHVRDMLIPPQRRNELYPIWDKAVEYLNENESRIRTENQCISGEEFMVWRWLQAANAGLQQKQDERIWQGYAFPEAEIGNNSPSYAYYECLKLRGLFDPDVEEGEEWPQHVQDAILEKLGQEMRVLHLALDMHSKDGCVYMKMASKEEAGEAFKMLNGSWFNGRLVSVKYLRPERYHQRFADAIKAYIPLSVKKNRNSMLTSGFRY